MDAQKNLFQLLGDWFAMRQAHRQAITDAQSSGRLADWLPSRSNAIFTLAMIALLVVAQSVGALPLGHPQAAPSATSTGTIAYQGRLADSTGAALTGTYNMIFRLYESASDGVPLWEEQWTGSNGVQVSDGLFNVMLGNLTMLPQSVIAGRSQLFLGITVGTDDEMQPRVQLGSVPFAVQALSVPDGSVMTAKLGDDSVTSAKIANGAVTSNDVNFNYAASSSKGGAATDVVCTGCIGGTDIQDGQIVGGDLADNAVTSAKIADGAVGIADVGFNYAASGSKGGAASDVACSDCVGSSDIASAAVKANELDPVAFNNLTVQAFDFTLGCRTDYGNGHAGCERHYDFGSAFPNKTLYVMASIHLAGNEVFWHWVPAGVYNVTNTGFDLGFVTYTDTGSVGWYNPTNTRVVGYAVGY